jgi:hypothetical protein
VVLDLLLFTADQDIPRKSKSNLEEATEDVDRDSQKNNSFDNNRGKFVGSTGTTQTSPNLAMTLCNRLPTLDIFQRI